MRSIKFPNMFSDTSTNVWKSDEYLKSTQQNMSLVLNTERGELIGDPYFGLLLKKYTFDQNNYILKDAIIDMIYTQVAIFIPQVTIKRKDIDIVQNKKKGQLICTITGTNQIDYKTNTYNLVMYSENETK